VQQQRQQQQQAADKEEGGVGASSSGSTGIGSAPPSFLLPQEPLASAAALVERTSKLFGLRTVVGLSSGAAGEVLEEIEGQQASTDEAAAASLANSSKSTIQTCNRN